MYFLSDFGSEKSFSTEYELPHRTISPPFGKSSYAREKLATASDAESPEAESDPAELKYTLSGEASAFIAKATINAEINNNKKTYPYFFI